ncbi:MAG TPA: metallophosphoesterase, partial [Pyrinomonadaceae bacterium]
MAREFYFVSDLHFGGDGQLQVCDFTGEFITFLRELAEKDRETELIIAGDTFGFWELTTVKGAGQLDEIIKHHARIFEQLKATGERVSITMMVGNHDYDLACDPVYREKLAAYNIRLDTSLSLVREIADRKIWVEHGQQIDPFNAAPDYGNPFALPPGFFITESVVSGASRFSVFGASDWLKDIRS